MMPRYQPDLQTAKARVRAERDLRRREPDAVLSRVLRNRCGRVLILGTRPAIVRETRERI